MAGACATKTRRLRGYSARFGNRLRRVWFEAGDGDEGGGTMTETTHLDSLETGMRIIKGWIAVLHTERGHIMEALLDECSCREDAEDAFCRMAAAKASRP